MAALPPRTACEIISVAHKHACRWKWRHVAADGRVAECTEAFEAYLECVAAARALGYAPRSYWTGPLALCLHRK
jgi:DNA-binding transcriptional LysR family regulator